ncbi:MAG: hypothetical protein RLZZ370_1051 [Bacteroidota bacterium]
MNNLQNLKEEELASMAMQIESLAEQKSEKDLYLALGNALYDSGIVLDEHGAVSLDAFDFFDSKQLNLSKSFDFVSDPTPLDKEASKTNGKKFWERFKDELRGFICEDAKIKAYMNDQHKLRECIAAALKLIFKVLGLLPWNPVVKFIASLVAALIVKTGFEAYCNIA